MITFEELLRGSIWQYFFHLFFSWWIDWHWMVFFEFLVFVYAALLLGDFLLSLFKIDFTGGKRVAYSIITGYGAFAFAGFLLGLLGLFWAEYLWTFLIFVFLLSRRKILDHLKLLRAFTYPREFFIWLVILWAFVNFLIAFVPLTGTDTLAYHFPIMMDIVQNGRLTFSESVDSKYPWLTVGAEIFYAIPIAMFNNFTDPYIFQLLQYSALPLILAVFYYFLKDKLEFKFLAPVALLMVLSISDLQREALHGGYVEVITFLFCLTSVLLLFERKFILSGVMLGLGLSMKYVALFFAPINALILAIILIRERKDPRELIRTLFYYFLIALAIAGFWYAKNLLVFGNPVHPIFTPNPEDDVLADSTWFVTKLTLYKLPLFPFYAFGQWFVDATQTSSRLMVFAYFTVLYFLVAILLATRRGLGYVSWLLFIFIQLYLALLFFLSHQYRFLLPAIMLVPLLIVLLLDRFYSLFPVLAGWSRKLFAAGFIILFLGNFHYFGVKFLYLTGVYDRPTYIKEIGGQ